MLEALKQEQEAKEKEFEELIEEFYSNINWRALHAYLTTNDLPASVNSVVNLLEVSLDEANTAIESLFKLGLLKKEGDKYKAGRQQFLIPENLNRIESRVMGHKTQSRQILNSLSSDKAREKDGYGYTYYISSNKEAMTNFRKKYSELLKELEKESEKTQDGVYAITVTDVELIKRGGLN